jgi:hypothetical protein
MVPAELRRLSGMLVFGDAGCEALWPPWRADWGRELPTLVRQRAFDVPVVDRTVHGWLDLDAAGAARRVAEPRRRLADARGPAAEVEAVRLTVRLG